MEAMTPINYELLGEIIMMNDAAFKSVDINKAKVLRCLCKTASHNKNIKECFDREKAEEYFYRVSDIVCEYLMTRWRSADKEVLRKDDLDELIKELQGENVNVLDGFRELIVLELKEYIYNYENCNGSSFDVYYNLDYCDQYFHIVDYFGYYEYYESHIYNPAHFVLNQDSIYDFANAASVAVAQKSSE
jgi:hypothetical protein